MLQLTLVPACIIIVGSRCSGSAEFTHWRAGSSHKPQVVHPDNRVKAGGEQQVRAARERIPLHGVHAAVVAVLYLYFPAIASASASTRCCLFGRTSDIFNTQAAILAARSENVTAAAAAAASLPADTLYHTGVQAIPTGGAERTARGVNVSQGHCLVLAARQDGSAVHV
jgi:hypothetical protein